MSHSRTRLRPQTRPGLGSTAQRGPRLPVPPSPLQRKRRSGPGLAQGSFWPCRDLPLSGVVFFSLCFVVVIIVVVETGRGRGAGQSRRRDTGARTRWPSRVCFPPGFPRCLRSSSSAHPRPPQPRHRPGGVVLPSLSSVKPSGLSALPRLLSTSAFRPVGPLSLMCLKGPRCLLPAPQKASRMPTR